MYHTYIRNPSLVLGGGGDGGVNGEKTGRAADRSSRLCFDICKCDNADIPRQFLATYQTCHTMFVATKTYILSPNMIFYSP